jgi:hypothetical protein
VPEIPTKVKQTMLRILISVLLLAVAVNGFTASNTRTTQEGRSNRWIISSTPTTTVETPKTVNGDAAVAEIPNVEVVEQVKLEGVTIFEAVASHAASCLFESDKRRDAKGKASGTPASSATNWIDDATAFSLQKAFDRLRLKVRREKLGRREYASRTISRIFFSFCSFMFSSQKNDKESTVMKLLLGFDG